MLNWNRSRFLALAAALLGSACGLFDGGPDVPPHILYTALPNTRSDLQVFGADELGRSSTKITDTPGDKGQPTWSPDGSKIAFTWVTRSQTLIYVANADGSNPFQVTPDVAPPNQVPYDSPAWSPSGTQIAYSLIGAGPIWIINTDGTGNHRLTPDTIIADDPSWAPNGLKIAFWGVATGATAPEVYTINPDGTGLVNLTNSAFGDTDPAYSPDGTRIAYDADNGGFLKIYVMDANGGNAHVVATHPTNQSFAHPRWSPDGTRLVFGSADGIWTVNVDGTTLRAVITDRLASDPDWH